MMRLLYMLAVLAMVNAATISIFSSTISSDLSSELISMEPGDVTIVTGDVTESAESTTESAVSTTESAESTTESISSSDSSIAEPSRQPCTTTTQQIINVYNYTNIPEFQSLSENQQIVIYELLAAAEACRLSEFINRQTVLRLVLLTEALPLKYVYPFLNFISTSLLNEGVTVPV